MGRYPMHFHLLGDSGSRSYLTDCSIHRSYYRAVSLHGTHGATVSQTVAYDVTGMHPRAFGRALDISSRLGHALYPSSSHALCAYPPYFTTFPIHVSLAGHAFYLEDGVEERNRIEYNLAVRSFVSLFLICLLPTC